MVVVKFIGRQRLEVKDSMKQLNREARLILPVNRRFTIPSYSIIKQGVDRGSSFLAKVCSIRILLDPTLLDQQMIYQN